jgi:hypothetical protein
MNITFEELRDILEERTIGFIENIRPSKDGNGLEYDVVLHRSEKPLDTDK